MALWSGHQLNEDFWAAQHLAKLERQVQWEFIS